MTAAPDATRPPAADIRPVEGALPLGLETLRTEAAADGLRLLERLVAEWEAGTQRFDRAGELLVAAYIADRLVGIGGLSADPILGSALRMRRFYVLREARRLGIGTALERHSRELSRKGFPRLA